MFAATAQAVSFKAAVNYSAGTTPVGVAVGNFNADANADLAVANLSTNNVSILLGTGTGTFGAATNFTVGAASLPRGIAIGDFNGDGKQDLVTANSNGNTVSILIGTGTGTFGAPTTYPVGTSPRQVAVNDLNGDGKLDLAVANATTNNVSILLGTGTGTFGTATNFAVGTSPRSVAVGNYDNDGNPDLAVANATSNDVSILLGTGTGSFGSATNFAVGSEPRMVVTGDFNGDSKRDLAVANNISNNVSVLLGTGTGSFGSATNYNAGSGPVAVAKADFNGDSKDDLAIANNGSTNASVLLGDGSGGFGAPSSFATPGAPAWIATGLFNGDSRPDIVVPNGTTLATSFVSVLIAKTQPSLSTSADPTAALGSPISDKATLSGGSSPTGTIVFKAYGPDDADCSGTPAFTSSAVSVSGNGNYQSPSFTPDSVGTYRWIASYSGDAENGDVSGSCNDSGESSVVSEGAATSALMSSTAVSPSTGLKTGGGNNAGLFMQTRTCNDDDSACSSNPFNPSTQPPNVKTATLYFSKQVGLPKGTSGAVKNTKSCDLSALATASSTKAALTACSASAIGQGQANACIGGGIGKTCVANLRLDVSAYKLASSGDYPQIAFYADLGTGSSPASGGNPLLVGTLQPVPKGPLTTAGYAKQLVVQVPNTADAGAAITTLFSNIAFYNYVKVNCASTPGTGGTIKYAAAFDYWQDGYADNFNATTQSCSTASLSRRAKSKK